MRYERMNDAPRGVQELFLHEWYCTACERRADPARKFWVYVYARESLRSV